MGIQIHFIHDDFSLTARKLRAGKRRVQLLAPCAAGKAVAGEKDRLRSFCREGIADKRRDAILFRVVPETEIIGSKAIDQRMSGFP